MPTSSEADAAREERRAKRAARRAKQREANAGRAAKMHEERLRYEGEFALDAGGHEADGLRNFQVGCSGWFYWHWRGGFYPEGKSTSEWFRIYAEHFRTVELNAPFYSWPTSAAVRTWLRQIGRRRFVYTVKVCELITHVKQFVEVKELVRDFGLIADLLGPRMGCFLFQLPPSFHYSSAKLSQILSQLDPARRNVVEFRHRSWWNDKVFAAFESAGVIFCSCSGPRLPEELVKTADEIYVRFHGTRQWYRHDYSAEEIDPWVTRIQASGARRVWAYFNNDRECYAIRNARSLLRRLQAVEGSRSESA